jgi:hypothetical protein
MTSSHCQRALNYVADMTWCGTDAEWHLKPGYDPQIVLDAIAEIATLKEVDAKRFALFQLRNEQIEKLEATITDADKALCQLLDKHGWATGHGDTLTDLIGEVDAEIVKLKMDLPSETEVRLRAVEAALREIIEIDHHPDATIARRTLDVARLGAARQG